MFKKFKILPIASADFDQELCRVVLPFQGNPGPLARTLEMVKQPPSNCRTAIFEYDYVDQDYQDEFSAFYSKAFKTYPSRCVRLHLFSCPIPPRTKTGFGRYQRHYKGFIVIRPTDLQRMGRTLLIPPIADPNREFVHCSAPFSAHVLGERFTLNAMPFVQQDTQVGACAQASLWMVARYMSRRFGHREFLPAEINEFAKARNAHGRALPAERGLLWAQMLDALDGMGFFAWSYSIYGLSDCSQHIDAVFPIDPASPQREQQLASRLSAKLADITYRYIESGLPVILGTNNHALVAIGHTYDPAAPASVAIKRIPEFMVHNDAEGPYLRMPVFTHPPGMLPFRDVQQVIAVVPKEVTLRGEEAEAMAVNCIQELLGTQTNNPAAPTFRELVQNYRPEFAPWLLNLEYRTFMMPSVDFQAQLRSDIKNGRFNRVLGNDLLCLDYPRFIWISEISSSSLLNHPVRNQRCCLGRVIIDSSAPAKTKGQMVIHFCDFVKIIDRQNAARESCDVIPNSTPFGHKIVH